MGHHKIKNLLDATSDNVFIFISKKWAKGQDHLGCTEDRYTQHKQIRFKNSMLRSDLYDYSDAYIAVKGDITLRMTGNRDRVFIYVRNRILAFKNNAPFTESISKIIRVLTDNAEDLDVVIPV